jgi:hypothetical protein
MCPDNACTSDQSDLLHTAHLNATLSTIGYLTAAGGAALGTILFFTVGREDQAPQATAARNSSRASLRVGPLGADVALKF